MTFSADFEKEAVSLPVRSLSDTSISVVGESPWTRIASLPGMLHSRIVNTVELAFDNGGFVAGGFARWILSNDPSTPLDRGCYVKLGGDIDLFFNDAAGWIRFLDAVEAADWSKHIESSIGKFAANITYEDERPYPAALIGQQEGVLPEGGWKATKHNMNRYPVVQAIRCVTGDPATILRSFDILASMVAFDRDNTYVADGWGQYEEARILGIVNWSSRNLRARINKYVSKYGYDVVCDCSGRKYVEQFMSAVERVDPHKLPFFFNAWKNLTANVNFAPESIGAELLCCLSEVSVSAIGDAIRSKNFERKSMMDRIRDEVVDRDVPGLHEAEDYCWAI